MYSANPEPETRGILDAFKDLMAIGSDLQNRRFLSLACHVLSLAQEIGLASVTPVTAIGAQIVSFFCDIFIIKKTC